MIATLPPLDPHGVAMRQDLDACARQALPWCGVQVTRPDGRPDPVRVQRAAFSAFSVSTAGLNIGLRWTSHARDADDARPWDGLCGDMTFTVLDLLDARGFPRDRMWRALVIDGRGDTPNHMVGIIARDDGLWVVGDTDNFGHDVYPLRSMRYRLVYLSRVSDGALWHKVKP